MQKKINFISSFIYVITALVIFSCSNDGQPKPLSAKDSGSIPSYSSKFIDSAKPVTTDSSVADISKLTNGYRTVALLNGLLTVDLPEDFTPLSEELKSLKYPGKNAPQEVYGNQDGSVSFGISNTGIQLSAKEFDNQFSKTKQALEAQTEKIKELKAKSSDVQSKQIKTLEFYSLAIDTWIYNKMSMVMIDDKLVVFTFNATDEKQKIISPKTDEKIYQSIRFR